LAFAARSAAQIGRKEHGAPGEDDNIQELPLTHYYSITGHAIKLRIVRRVNELIISSSSSSHRIRSSSPRGNVGMVFVP
jgi:hypothetical protein